VVDNSQGIFQLVGPKGKVFVPRRVLLDSGAQPLMLEASAVAGLELTKDTLEECPWTISTSIGETERAIGITKAELSLKTQPGGCGRCRLHESKGHCHGGQVIRCLGRDDGAVSHGVHSGLLGRDSKLETSMASRR
jgi:hypothetical protein